MPAFSVKRIHILIVQACSMQIASFKMRILYITTSHLTTCVAKTRQTFCLTHWHANSNRCNGLSRPLTRRFVFPSKQVLYTLRGVQQSVPSRSCLNQICCTVIITRSHRRITANNDVIVIIILGLAAPQPVCRNRAHGCGERRRWVFLERTQFVNKTHPVLSHVYTCTVPASKHVDRSES